MEGIDLAEHPFFDFVLVQDDTQIREGRILVCSSKHIILVVKSRCIEFACGANTILVGIECLDHKTRAIVFAERVVQEVEILLCRCVVRNI